MLSFLLTDSFQYAERPKKLLFFIECYTIFTSTFFVLTLLDYVIVAWPVVAVVEAVLCRSPIHTHLVGSGLFFQRLSIVKGQFNYLTASSYAHWTHCDLWQLLHVSDF